MSDGIYSALSGAIASQRSLDVTANNVANANTTGFRADRVAFREFLSAARPNPEAPDALRYTTISQVQTDDSAGSLQQTGNPLDVALQGDGFFAVRTPQGERYTRAGSFVTDGEGQLQTQQGLPVLGRPTDPQRRPEPIVIPAGTAEIQVGSDGTIAADGVPVGQLRVVRFAPDALEKQGDTLFAVQGGQAAPDEETQVVQGFLETANVNAVRGMNELITASRSFEAFQRVIQGFRQIDERTARDLGGK